VVATILYFLLGFLLSMAGVGITQQPGYFFAIIAVVLGINVLEKLS
jgi:hypothetical protein